MWDYHANNIYHPSTSFKFGIKLSTTKNSFFNQKNLFSELIKGTLMQIWKSHYVCAHKKTISWKFRILNPNKARDTYTQSLQIS